MTRKYAPIMLIIAAGVSLAACEKKTADAQADAVRDTTTAAASSMENKADVIENQADTTGAAVSDQGTASADALRDKADAVKAGGEAKADAIEDGTMGATTKTDTMTTTTVPTKK